MHATWHQAITMSYKVCRRLHATWMQHERDMAGRSNVGKIRRNAA